MGHPAGVSPPKIKIPTLSQKARQGWGNRCDAKQNLRELYGQNPHFSRKERARSGAPGGSVSTKNQSPHPVAKSATRVGQPVSLLASASEKQVPRRFASRNDKI